jgi:hypothetical protein
MSTSAFGERGGSPTVEDQASTGGTPGRETLTGQMGGTADPASSWGGAPRTATRIDMISGGGSDPFNFGSFSGGLGSNEEENIGGAATKSSTHDTFTATWSDHGRFKWWVGWGTDGTSGWIVQKVTNTYTGTKSDGSAITAAGVGVVPVYYEAWAVDATGRISPSAGATHDMWQRVPLGAGSKGTWSMRGDVYWTDSDPAASGLTAGGVRNAGILLSGTSAPAGLGGALQVRNASGAWDSSGATPTHTGKAT